MTHYEDLRRRVLDGYVSASRLGLALLMHQGLGAWIEAWPTCSARIAPATEKPAPAKQLLCEQVHADVVQVLTTMAMSGLEGRHA